MCNQYLYQANPNYILRHIAGETVLVAVGAGVADFRGYIQMNESAAEIWKVLQQKVNENQIIDHLLNLFDVSKDEVAKDVHQTLDLLISANMVTRYED